MQKVNNTIKYQPYWRTHDLTENDISTISAKMQILLKNHPKGAMQADELCLELTKLLPKFSTSTFKSIFTIDKNIKILDGFIGLTTNTKINPRTLRDKIYFVLRDTNKPLHFIEIANTIIGHQFDQKTIHVNAVHNECIRHNGFVLIGRGIYALKEWGYQVGTVKDVILDILKDGKPRSRDEIISEVRKQRMVKPVTIILNLKNPKIKRVGREQYQIV